MTPPTLRAIKCSERMPTRDDADAYGRILYLDAADGHVSLMCRYEQPGWATHFFPLNRSAIATDAEEQRGEGGE